MSSDGSPQVLAIIPVRGIDAELDGAPVLLGGQPLVGYTIKAAMTCPAVSRTIVKAMVEILRHEVTVAVDGESAWEIFQREEFGIVISDWLMPGIDGPELCRRIRSDTRPKYTYVIVLSAVRGGRLSYLEAMDSGADDFVTKPVELDQLAARIRMARRMGELRSEVQALRDILPICSYCKKIRTDEDAWSPIEAYVASRFDAMLSHGICPDCYVSEVVPDLERFPGNDVS